MGDLTVRGRVRVRHVMVWSAFTLLGLAAPAGAVRVTDVRVGQHDDYTRVVFDLDAPAGYRLERNEAGKTTEVLVRFDAGAQPKVVRSLSPLVEEVKLESRPEGAVARIVLRSRDVRLVDQVLSGPSRVVIDVRRGGGASAAPAKPPAEAKAAPAKPAAARPAAASTGAPTPAPAAPPKPAVAATVPGSRVDAPAPTPAPAAAPTPSAAPAPGNAPPPADTVAQIEAQADAAAARLLGEEKPQPKPAPNAPSLGRPTLATPPPPGAEPEGPGAPPVVAEAPRPTGPEPKLGPGGPAGPDAPVIPPPPKPTGPPLQMAKPPPGAIATQPGGPPPGARPASDTSIYQNWIYGGVFLFALFLIVALWRRRDRTEDIHTGALPADAFEDRAATFGDSEETVALRTSGAGSVAETAQMPVPGDFATSSERAVEIPAGAGSAGRDPLERAGRPQASLFEDEGGGVDAVEEKEIDELDVGRGAGVFGDRPDMGGFAPGLRSDDAVLRTLRDIEGRLAEIEGRLAREADARERVERQVVAQTEELRVQRAAIARTQRVLRTLSRPDDLATEPVIRSPGPGGSSGGGGSGSI